MIRWTGLLAVLLVVAACGNGQADTTVQAAAVGDPERGRQIWDDGGDTVFFPRGCSNCHSLDGSENVGAPPFRAPTFQGISGPAGDQVPLKRTR